MNSSLVAGCQPFSAGVRWLWGRPHREKPPLTQQNHNITLSYPTHVLVQVSVLYIKHVNTWSEAVRLRLMLGNGGGGSALYYSFFFVLLEKYPILKLASITSPHHVFSSLTKIFYLDLRHSYFTIMARKRIYIHFLYICICIKAYE